MQFLCFYDKYKSDQQSSNYSEGTESAFFPPLSPPHKFLWTLIAGVKHKCILCIFYWILGLCRRKIIEILKSTSQLFRLCSSGYLHKNVCKTNWNALLRAIINVQGKHIRKSQFIREKNASVKYLCVQVIILNHRVKLFVLVATESLSYKWQDNYFK